MVIGETAVVGDNCTIYHGVTLGGTGKGEGKRHPTVGNDVLLGAGVKVLGPIEIGDGSRIGAGSVVLRPVPAGATAIGIPAAVVRQNGRRVDPPASETLNQRDYPDLLHNQLAHLARRLDRLEGECGRGRSAR